MGPAVRRRRRLWQLRRSERTGSLFDELAMSDLDLLLQRTIAAISQSDPLIKLLEQVRLGRMQAGDPGLRAITESWLAEYRKAIDLPGLTRQSLLRIDPAPRLTVLMEQGMLSPDHEGVRRLLADFTQALSRASS